MSEIKIYKPHLPWGKHADVITPLGSGIRGVEKLRIDQNGQIISKDINIKGGWTLPVMDKSKDS